MGGQKSVLVIGAGIVGATTALALAERGYKVDIVDAGDRVASGASERNGAQLSYCYTDALGSPALLKAMPALLLGLEPAFHLHPRFDVDAIRWYLDFLKNCTLVKADANTLAVLKCGLQSRLVMEDWRARYGFEFAFRQAGKMHLHDSPQSLEAARRRVDLKNQLGAEQVVLSADEAVAKEPTLKSFGGSLAGAVYSPLDAVGDCALFAKAAIERALEIGGGRLLLATKIDRLLVENGRVVGASIEGDVLRADAYVLAAGYQIMSLVAGLRTGVNVMPSGGFSLTYSTGLEVPNISLTDVSAKLVVCRLGDKVRIAGLADLGAVRRVPPPKRLAVLKDVLMRRFPDLADYKEDGAAWAGSRPMSANGQYVALRAGAENLVLNCGHGMLGWTLSAASAQDAAGAVADILGAA